MIPNPTSKLPYDLPMVDDESQFLGVPVKEMGREDLLRLIRFLADHNQEIQKQADNDSKRFADYIRGHP